MQKSSHFSWDYRAVISCEPEKGKCEHVGARPGGPAPVTAEASPPSTSTTQSRGSWLQPKALLVEGKRDPRQPHSAPTHSSCPASCSPGALKVMVGVPEQELRTIFHIRSKAVSLPAGLTAETAET